jgi:chaperonin cofactor prefoldin
VVADKPQTLSRQKRRSNITLHLRFFFTFQPEKGRYSILSLPPKNKDMPMPTTTPQPELDTIWFERYKNINYSIAQWYIALSRRLNACIIFDKYFDPTGKTSTIPFPMLRHAGNGKYNVDKFLQTLNHSPDDRVFQVHAMLQVYYRHNLISADVASRLRKKFSHSDEDYHSLRQKLHAILMVPENKNHGDPLPEEVNSKKHQLHKTEKPKTQAFLDDLFLTMSTIDDAVDELKKVYDDRVVLKRIKEIVTSGEILNISDEELRIIYTDAPYWQDDNTNKLYTSLAAPVSTFTVFNMLQARENEPDEHVHAVAQMLLEGEASFFSRQLKNEMLTECQPEDFNQNSRPVELKILPANSPGYLLHDQLQTFGWGKSEDNDSISSSVITRALCSVDLSRSTEDLIYCFSSWVRQQKALPASPVSRRVLTSDEIKKNITELKTTIKTLSNKTTRVIHRLDDYKYYNLLCYLDYTLLSLICGQHPKIPSRAKSNELYKLITDETQKEKYIRLVRDAMSKEHIEDLWWYAFRN